MSLQGVPWFPPHDISDIFYKYKCNISDIAKHLSISRNCLYQNLKQNPELKAKLEEVRESLQTEWLDQAEKVVWYSLALGKENPQHALKAATYILDRKGGDRGWRPPEVPVSDVTTINFNQNYSNDDTDDSVKVLSEGLSTPDSESVE